MAMAIDRRPISASLSGRLSERPVNMQAKLGIGTIEPLAEKKLRLEFVSQREGSTPIECLSQIAQAEVERKQLGSELHDVVVAVNGIRQFDMVAASPEMLNEGNVGHWQFYVKVGDEYVCPDVSAGNYRLIEGQQGFWQFDLFNTIKEVTVSAGNDGRRLVLQKNNGCRAVVNGMALDGWKLIKVIDADNVVLNPETGRVEGINDRGTMKDSKGNEMKMNCSGNCGNGEKNRDYEWKFDFSSGFQKAEDRKLAEPYQIAFVELKLVTYSSGETLLIGYLNVSNLVQYIGALDYYSYQRLLEKMKKRERRGAKPVYKSGGDSVVVYQTSKPTKQSEQLLQVNTSDVKKIGKGARNMPKPGRAGAMESVAGKSVSRNSFDPNSKTTYARVERDKMSVGAKQSRHARNRRASEMEEKITSTDRRGAAEKEKIRENGGILDNKAVGKRKWKNAVLEKRGEKGKLDRLESSQKAEKRNRDINKRDKHEIGVKSKGDAKDKSSKNKRKKENAKDRLNFKKPLVKLEAVEKNKPKPGRKRSKRTGLEAERAKLEIKAHAGNSRRNSKNNVGKRYGKNKHESGAGKSETRRTNAGTRKGRLHPVSINRKPEISMNVKSRILPKNKRKEKLKKIEPVAKRLKARKIWKKREAHMLRKKSRKKKRQQLTNGMIEGKKMRTRRKAKRLAIGHNDFQEEKGANFRKGKGARSTRENRTGFFGSFDSSLKKIRTYERGTFGRGRLSNLGWGRQRIYGLSGQGTSEKFKKVKKRMNKTTGGLRRFVTRTLAI